MVPKPPKPKGPTCWDCGPGKSRHLNVDGLRVRYTGPGEHQQDAGSIRADAPVAIDTCIYYWEVEIISQGREGFIGVGFTTHVDKSNRLPGWDTGSWAYHGDDGNAFQGSNGVKYGPKFGTGDVIGAILNRAEKTISYTKNGLDLGVAFHNVKVDRLYPTVGLRTPDEEIVANFGATPFRYNADSIRLAAREKARQRIRETELPDGEGSTALSQMVFEHLKHSGYWRTAEALAGEVGGSWVPVSSSDVQEQQAREQVSAAVRQGLIHEAMALAENLAPGVINAHPSVALQLELQAFIELVRRKDTAAATNQAQFLGGLNTTASSETLMEVVSLLAFENPENCPSSHWLDLRVREEAAAALNGAILHQQGKPERSCLELAYRQVRVVERELLAVNDVSTLLVDLSGMLKDIGFKS